MKELNKKGEKSDKKSRAKLAKLMKAKKAAEAKEKKRLAAEAKKEKERLAQQAKEEAAALAAEKARVMKMQKEAAKIISKVYPLMLGLGELTKNSWFTKAPAAAQKRALRAMQSMQNMHTEAEERVKGASKEPLSYTIDAVQAAAKEGTPVPWLNCPSPAVAPQLRFSFGPRALGPGPRAPCTQKVGSQSPGPWPMGRGPGSGARAAILRPRDDHPHEVHVRIIWQDGRGRPGAAVNGPLASLLWVSVMRSTLSL